MFLFLILILIGLSLEGFFSGSEIAFVSVNRVHLFRASERGVRRAHLILGLLRKPEPLLATTLIGTDISVVLTAFSANELFLLYFGRKYAFFSPLVVIPLILIFGELLPKAFFRAYAERMVLLAIYPLRFFMFLLYPVVLLVSAITGGLSRKEEGRSSPYVTREELKLLLLSGKEKQPQRMMLTAILELLSTRVGAIMTPLIKAVMVEENAPLREVVAKMRREGFSRIPVYRERVDNIIGLVEAKDLLTASRGDRISHFMKQVPFIPELARVENLLSLFGERERELAVVVDEYGSAVGIVSIEDVLEEVVGEIIDEFDRGEEKKIIKLNEREFITSSSVRLSELSSYLDLSFPEGDYDTLAGFLLDLAQEVPPAGAEFTYQGTTFKILTASERGIGWVKVVKSAP